MAKKTIIATSIILIVLIVLGIIVYSGKMPLIRQETIAGTGANKNQWNPTLQSCSTQEDCIQYLKSNGINKVLIDWVRCENTCQFFDGNPETYTGEIL